MKTNRILGCASFFYYIGNSPKNPSIWQCFFQLDNCPTHAQESLRDSWRRCSQIATIRTHTAHGSVLPHMWQCLSSRKKATYFLNPPFFFIFHPTSRISEILTLFKKNLNVQFNRWYFLHASSSRSYTRRRGMTDVQLKETVFCFITLCALHGLVRADFRS